MIMILIADDDLDFAENCSMMLEAHGYDVNVVSDGVEALKEIRQQQPELLISDCSMPNMGGLELSKEVRARPGEAQFPVLLMSSSPKSQVAPGISYDSFLRKPFLAEDLLLEVRKLIANHMDLTQNKKGNA
jgi:CheY-like chemotaxis protein